MESVFHEIETHPLESIIWNYYEKRLPLSFYLGNDVISIAQNLIGKLIWSRTATGSSQKDILTCGRITETEAYKFPNDKANHAYNYRKTARNSMMYNKGGVAYVYICYGVHSMMNVVTNETSIADAVLLRSIEPLIGLNIIKNRKSSSKTNVNNKITISKEQDVKDLLKKPKKFVRFLTKKEEKLGAGPGNLTKSLAISIKNNGADLVEGNEIWITESPGLEEVSKFMKDWNCQTESLYPEKISQTENYLNHMQWMTGNENIESSRRIGIESAGEDAKLPWRFFIKNHPCVSTFK